MEHDISHENNTTSYVQDLKKLKFSVFWSKVEATLIKHFLGTGSRSIKMPKEKNNKKI